MEIRAEKLEIAYGDYTAVKDMDIRVQKGKITSIIGPNGSGKSTVLKGLTRLLEIRRRIPARVDRHGAHAAAGNPLSG